MQDQELSDALGGAFGLEILCPFIAHQNIHSGTA
jgi:hypothetical protein